MRTALLQSSGRPGSIAENLKVLDEAAGRAAAAGAGLLAAPEMFLTGYAIGDDIARLAEPADGDSADAIAEIATRHGLALAYGYPERDGDAVFNSAQLVSADGTRLANYRKTHLFGCFERDHFTPGEQQVVQAELNGFTVGLLICYDVEFPEAVRSLAAGGARAVLVPTANPTGAEQVQEFLVRARACENNCGLVYANYCGADEVFEYNGLSTICGPKGEVLAQADAKTEEVIIADLPGESTGTYLADRRADLYGG